MNKFRKAAEFVVFTLLCAALFATFILAVLWTGDFVFDQLKGFPFFVRVALGGTAMFAVGMAMVGIVTIAYGDDDGPGL
jgi:hypothetical protein